jgi:hypothetical protein
MFVVSSLSPCRNNSDHLAEASHSARCFDSSPERFDYRIPFPAQFQFVGNINGLSFAAVAQKYSRGCVGASRNEGNESAVGFAPKIPTMPTRAGAYFLSFELRTSKYVLFSSDPTLVVDLLLYFDFST